MAVPETHQDIKVDGYIRSNIQMLSEEHTPDEMSRMQQPVLMRVEESFGKEESSKLESLGVKIGTRIGGILSAHIPANLDKVDEIAKLEFVKYIEASR